MIVGRKIIIFSTMDFYDLPTRKQRIALNLSEKNKVLYLEPPKSYLSLLFEKVNKVLKEKRINDNLTVLKLPYILPFNLRFSVINRINSVFLEKYIKRYLRKTCFNNYLLWLYLIDFPYLYRRLDSKFIIYDCVDDHSSYGGLRSKSFVNRCEEEVAEVANVIFATTEKLSEKLRRYNSNVYTVSNGVDYEFFEKNKTTSIPTDISFAKRPIIGYFGAIREWFDFEAVVLASRELKDASFVIVGPYREDMKKKLTGIENIYLLGEKSYDLAPSYISSFDVCLIPFVINELTLNVSPLKLYEYFSLGKPVVTIPISGILKFSDLLYIYSKKEEIVFCINKALKESDNILKEKRFLIAKENSWNEKFNFMFDKIVYDFRIKESYASYKKDKKCY